MVAIFVGSGAGFQRGSGATLGSSGVLGSALQGRGGETVSVNAATGNLLISHQDEFLVGRGPDVSISRTYNSLAQMSDGDNGDQWQMSTVRRVFGLTGTLNAAGSTISHQGGDGAVILYAWNAAEAAYVTTDGDGAHDKLVRSGAIWVRTDGSTQHTETYEASTGDANTFRIKEQNDPDGSKLSFAYVAGTDKLYRVTTYNHGTANADTGIAEQSYVEYSWSGNNITQIVTGYTDYGDRTTEADNVNKTLTRTRYGYDAQNRLIQVTVDLSPENNSVSDGKTYVTTYSYDGSSKRVASITQTDGSSLAIAYDASGRVATLTQMVAAGSTRVTALAYGANYTNVTGPDGQVTRLDYAGGSMAPSSILGWSSNPSYVTKEIAGAIDGEVAGLFTSTPGAAWSGVSSGGFAVAAGDQVHFALSLQAVSGSATSQSLGLYGTATAWGATGDGTARILSGPGHLVALGGGFWRVEGLSTTEATRIEIIRTYSQNDTAAAYFYVDSPTFGDGQQLIAAGGIVTKNAPPGADFRQLTKITAPPAYAGATARTVQFAYDASGNLTTATDGAGKVSTFTYDANGNILTGTDANGNVVTRTYGAKNELLTETRTGSDASGASVSHTTRYAYDAYNRLRYIVSAEGQVSEYRYSNDGTIHQVEYPEHGYPIGSGALAEATLNTWRDGLSDRSSIKIVYTPRDIRGNIFYSASYGIATAAGVTSTAEGMGWAHFAYDQSGRLIARYNQGENSETFVYDGLGRLVASTDLAGQTTTIVFNDAALTTTVTTGSGFTTVSSYNKAGDLIAESHSGSYDASGTANYLYDRNGRVRVATDATGYKNYYLYDKAGRKVADINHYGHVTEYRYDAAGRVAATASYATALTAAQITALGDPDNSIEMADLRPAAHSSDIWSWSVYDDAGRLIQSIDGDGGVAVFSYDASDQLIKTVSYYDKLSAGQLTTFRATPPTALILPTANAVKDAVSRSFYDRDGRLIGALDGEGYLTEVVYDKAGQKVEEIAYAAKTSSSYWASGSFDQLRASAAPTSGANRRMHYVYDGRGLLRYTVDNSGFATSHAYNYAGQATTTIVHAAPISTSDFTYDNVKALVNAIANDTNDRESYNIYNANGQIAYAIDGGNAVTGFAYDVAGNVAKTVRYAVLRNTPSLPALSTMDSWASGQASNAANRVARSWYTAGGDLRFAVDAEGYVKRFDYDAEGRLTREASWANKVTATDTTTIAQIDSLAGAAGDWIDVRYTYDAAGRRNSVYDGEGNRTVYSWYANGKLNSIFHGYGTTDQSRTAFGYNGAGQLINEHSAYGETEESLVQYAYDGLGNRISVTDPLGKVTSFTYDERGQILTKTDAAGGVTIYEYNAFGEVVKTTDPQGGATYSYYDELGRATMVRDAESHITETSYTAFGEVAGVTRRYNKTASTASTTTPPSVTAHAKDAVTSFLYDKRGLVVAAADAENKSESYSHDAFGNRTGVTNKLGGATEYIYDKRGLLISQRIQHHDNDNVGDWTTTRFVYDARGNRTQTIEAEGLPEERVTTYVYDKANRLIETWGEARTILDSSNHVTTTANFVPKEIRTYDARGNVTSVTDPAGNRSVYHYDDLDRVTVGIDAAGTYTANIYDKNGNVTETRVYETPVTIPANGGSEEEAPVAPSGASRATSFTYDNLNRLLTSSVAGAKTGYWNGSSWVASTGAIGTSYQYDARGNVVKATDANGNAVFSYYDALSRKTHEVDAEGYLTAWTHDAEGNVLTERRYATRYTGTPTTSAPPSLSTHAADRLTTYTYDCNGNRLTEARSSVAVHNGSGGTSSVTATVRFWYNALGLLVQKDEATDAGGYFQPNDESIYYDYDMSGRLTSEKRAAFTAADGSTVMPHIYYKYDGLDNLVGTEQYGAGDAATRTTAYTYGAGGLLASTTDAGGVTRSYAYDKNGNRIREQYTRTNAAGTGTLNAVLTHVDALGRTIERAVAAWSGSAWTKGDVATTEYNAYGEVSRSGINGGAVAPASRLWQTENEYDAAGRLWATNAGDGVWKMFGYDKNGNRTIAIASAGTSLTGLTFDQALALVSGTGVNATYTVYDDRNLATSVVEEGRQLSSSGSATLTTSRSYNAFGEVMSETDANGATTTYAYNNIGRMIRFEGPTVEITLENGTALWVKPSQDYYYDASGRLVASRDANGSYAAGGTSANGTSKAADTGNLTRLTLLAGTGYNGSEALVTAETHADGGIRTTKYDIHGDARTLIDEVGRTTTQVFDRLGRVAQINHAGGLTDYYAYDGLGQRLAHWNNQLGSGDKETTDYDTQGRVTATRAFGGDTTTTSYTWDATIAASGMGVTTGGWTVTTSAVADRASTTDQIFAIIEKNDIYDRTADKTDAGGQDFSYGFDVAGRLTSETSVSYSGASLRKKAITYFNTGHIATIANGDATTTTADWQRYVTSYGYDAAGNQLTEEYVRYWGDYTPGYWFEWAPGEPEYQPAEYVSGSDLLQNGVATYDFLGRMTRYRDAATSGPDNVDKTWAYDANGNIRNIATSYRAMQATGTLASTTSALTHWYRYDSMNRTVVSKGILSGGTIVRGTTGTDIGYDGAGQRATAQTGSGAQEVYGYNSAGLITSVVIGGVTRATTSFDIAGRVTGQVEYDASGALVYERHSLVYDARGQILAEKARTKEGSNWIYTHVANYYSANGTGSNPAAISSSAATGTSTGSILYYSETKYWKNGTNPPYYGSPGNYSSYDLDYADAYNSFTYGWSDGAYRLSETLTNRDGTSQSQYSYDRDLHLVRVQITGGARPRTIAYTNNAGGQVIARSEADTNASLADPSSRSWFFAGRQMGEVSNNGTDNVNYTIWIGNRTNVDGTGPFREGGATASIFADFDQNYTAMNGGVQASSPGGYQVQAGDTLQGIAASLWGDASLWYKLAEANGLAGMAGLAPGMTLRVPTGVVGSHNDADTFKAYDPAKAIGNVSPNIPLPPKANKNCGVFGQILVAVVAVAVVALTQQYEIFAGLSPVLGGAATAVTASVASQAYGLATGLQDKLSWKGVGIAAISGGIGGAVAPGANFLGRVAVGAAANAATQGVAVATGLQSKFDFAGVAAAGIGAGVGGAIGGAAARAGAGRFGASLLANTAAGIANAATRSAWNGNSFGDNLRAAIPDMIAGAIGDGISGRYASTRTGSAKEASETADAMAGIRRGSEAVGKVLTSGQNAEEIVVTAQLAPGWGADRFWGLQSGRFSPAYQRAYTQLQARAQSLIAPRTGNAHGFISDSSLDYTIATSGFNSAAASPDGNVLATFEIAAAGGATPEQLLEQLYANGLLGTEARGDLGISRTEFSAYNLLAKNDPFILRQIMPALNDLAQIDSHAAALKGYIDGEFNRLDDLATSTVDVGVVGTFGRTGATLANGYIAAADMAYQLWTGDLSLTQAGLEGGVALAGFAITRGRMPGGVAAETAGARFGGAYATNGELVQSIGTRADNWGIRNGLGNGPLVGTAKHGYAENLLNRYQLMFGDRGLSAEARYVGGTPWREGRPLIGSLRLDVIEGRLANPTHVWDYKFGNATLSQSRINQIQNGIPNGANVPILMVKP